MAHFTLRSRRRLLGVVAPLIASAIAIAGAVVPTATAGSPAPTDGALATVTETQPPKSYDPVATWHALGVKTYWAHSPSMERDIPLAVIPPQEQDASKPRPILYVLNGGDGGEGGVHWLAQTDIVNFYSNKNVWVVIPMAGRFSYYSDWVTDVPALGGKQKWETFLTHELPSPLQKALNASDKRGLIGMSMSATTALLLPERHPGFYDAVGSFSGCAETSRGFPLEFLRITLNRGGAKPEQMWGPIAGPNFENHDALLNAERLRGQNMYISNGTGLAGPYDMLGSKWTGADSGAVATHIINGGVIEAATNRCTHDLKAKLDSLGIPADWNLRPMGTHTWGYWQQDLRDSWPTFAKAFGGAAEGYDPQAPDPSDPHTRTVTKKVDAQAAITEDMKSLADLVTRTALNADADTAVETKTTHLPDRPANETVPEEPKAPADEPAVEISMPVLH